MKSFKLIAFLLALTSWGYSQTFEEAKSSESTAYVQGVINGSMEEGLPITYTEKGVVFLLTDISGKEDSVFYNKGIKYLGTSSQVLVKGSYKDGQFKADEVFTQSLTDDREVAEMASVFRKDGRIYVVIIIFSLLLSGLIFYLILLDRKVKKLERE